MKQLQFQGYSDDTFACTGPGIGVDVDNCASGLPVWMRVESGAEALIVSGQYAHGPNAGWSIGVSPASHGREERHIPEWYMRFVQSEREYSPLFLIDAPDDVKVFLVDKKGRNKSRDYLDLKDPSP